MTVQRVETKGSWWLIDEDARRYCRFPKDEGGRERPEWGGPDAGALRDAVWHDFTGRWRYDKLDGLLIEVSEADADGKAVVVKAPPSFADWVDALAGEDEP